MMDFKERESLVRRITSGKLYCTVEYRYDKYDVIFRDPTLDILTEADWIYKKEYDDCVARGDMMTAADALAQLIEDGRWSKALDEKLSGLYADIKQLHEKLTTMRFHKGQQKIIKKTIETGKKQIQELESQKSQLLTSTVEFICDRRRKNFIISRIVDIADKGLLQNQDFLQTLCYAYYNDHFLEDKTIRYLARTDPWRLYWTLAKDTSTPLFPSACNITTLQYNLTSWTRVYDFAYSSMNRPMDDVIEDDDKFDAWYMEEIKRMNQEVKQNSIQEGDGLGIQEVFIPADLEGAKEVYDLNDPIARKTVKDRFKVIEEKGEVKQLDLPDMRNIIKMESNKIASQQILNQGK